MIFPLTRRSESGSHAVPNFSGSASLYKQIPAFAGMTVFFLFLFTFSLNAQDGIPPRPDPPRLVNDLGDILTPSEEQQLESKLVAFNDSTGNQIVVLTVNDLGDYDRAEFTYTVGEKWGVGQKGFDNGVVVMVKASGGQGQRHTFIAPGYGLEAVIPDATAHQIIENEMIPHFKSNDYFGGIDRATDILMALASKEFTAEAYTKKAKKDPVSPLAGFLIVALILLFAFIMSRKQHSIGHKMPWWAWLLLLNSGGRHRGSFGDFSSGRGGFGGGGGFSGFGGGSFGGGGAGGSW